MLRRLPEAKIQRHYVRSVFKYGNLVKDEVILETENHEELWTSDLWTGAMSNAFPIMTYCYIKDWVIYSAMIVSRSVVVAQPVRCFFHRSQVCA